MANNSRRDFVKKAAYISPLILSLPAVPSLAKNGSVRSTGNNGIGQEKRGIFDGPPRGLATKPNADFNDSGQFASPGQSGGTAPAWGDS